MMKEFRPEAYGRRLIGREPGWRYDDAAGNG